MANDSINTRAEFALYAMAIKHPETFREAEDWQPGMLAGNRGLHNRVTTLLDEHVTSVRKAPNGDS